jgi:hypothetical protein
MEDDWVDRVVNETLGCVTTVITVVRYFFTQVQNNERKIYHSNFVYSICADSSISAPPSIYGRAYPSASCCELCLSALVPSLNVVFLSVEPSDRDNGTTS